MAAQTQTSAPEGLSPVESAKRLAARAAIDDYVRDNMVWRTI